MGYWDSLGHFQVVTSQGGIDLFSKKQYDNVPMRAHAKGEYSLIQLLLDLDFVASRSEARRLIAQRAVRVNDLIIEGVDAIVRVESGTLLQAGKRRFARIS